MTPLELPAGIHLVDYDRLGSTSDELKRLGDAGALEGTVVWAREQFNGHGRHQRVWISPPGNLYFSLLLRPQRSVAELMRLTFLAAVAVAEAIAGALPARSMITCKWPNDVLVDGKKVAGILLETTTTPDGAIDGVVIGIGINVATHPPAEEVDYPATSLSAEGAGSVTASAALQACCATLLDWYRRWLEEGFEPVRAAWMARAHRLGEEVAVRLEGEIARGRFAGLNEQGALMLECTNGRRAILAGDVLAAPAH